MDKKKYDELDKLFQSRLKNENIESEDWNTPPSDLLSNALLEIKGNKKRKNRWMIIWIPLSIALITLLGLNLKNHQKISRLESTILSLQSEKVFNNNNNQELSIVQVEKELDNNIQATQESTDDKQAIITEVVPPDQVHYSIKNQSKKGATVPFFQSESILFDSLDIPKEISNAENIKKTKANIETLRSPEKNKNLIKINVKELKAEVPLFEKYIEPLVKSSKRKSINPFIYFGYQMSSIRMTNPQSSSFSLTGYENYQGGYFGGAGIDYALNDRYTISANAGFNCMYINSLFEDEIIYDKSNEYINEEGQKMYDSNIDIESVIGRQSTSLLFDLENMSLENDDILDNETEIREKFKTINFGIGSQYHFLRFNQFNLSVGGGVNSNYLIGLDEKMETTISYKTAVMVKKQEEMSSLEKASRLYFSLYANLELNYDISDHLKLKMSSGLDHSISSIRTATNSGDSKTFLNNTKLQLALSYKF